MRCPATVPRNSSGLTGAVKDEYACTSTPSVSDSVLNEAAATRLFER